jgi:plasmid stabilization system protein ParE
MPTAHWTHAAEADVEAIYEWIARRDGRRSTAKKNVRELRQQCDEYAEAFAAGSVIGTARPDLGDSHRLFAYKRWVIIFRPMAGGIEVLRLLEGSRDYPRLFGN